MKKILFVTSTRADFGLVAPFYLLTKEQTHFQAKLLVTGTHLLKSYGNTINEIYKKKIKIDYQLSIFPEDFLKVKTTTLIAKSLLIFSKFLESHEFDYVVLLGDRFEIYAFSLATFMKKIRIIHLYGGETTEGAYDEAFRHMITKMSLYHFTSTEAYRHRVIQMGEAPPRVFNIGAIGVENILKFKRMPLYELSQKLGLKISTPCALVTFHPETMNKINPVEQIEIILSVCQRFPQIQFFFTKSNADEFGQQINDFLEIKLKTLSNVFLFDSLGTELYHSLMAHCTFIMGNSSSGLIEAPSLNIPVINLGIRQKGRIAPQQVIHVPIQSKKIYDVIISILNKKIIKPLTIVNPYGDGRTSLLFKEFLNQIATNDNDSIMKTFYDLKEKI